MKKTKIIFVIIATLVALSFSIWHFFLRSTDATKMQKLEKIETLSLVKDIDDIKVINKKSEYKNFKYDLDYLNSKNKDLNEFFSKKTDEDKNKFLSELKGDNYLLSSKFSYSNILNNQLMIMQTNKKVNNESYNSIIYNFKENSFIKPLEVFDNIDKVNEEIVKLCLLDETIKTKLTKKDFDASLENNKNLFSNYKMTLDENKEDLITFYFSTNDNLKDVKEATVKFSTLIDYVKEDYKKKMVKNPKYFKRVALTFDDGPHPTLTPKLLDILKQYDAKATFFMQGKNVKVNEEIVKRVIEEGHSIGNHTWNHPNLVKISSEQVKKEIEDTSEVLKNYGAKIIGLRPPYGSINSKIAAEVNMPIIMWSVDTQDWLNRNPKKILAKVKVQTTNGGIILMHDIHSTSIAAVPAVIEYLKSQGYDLVTVDELLNIDLEKNAGKTYINASTPAK